MNESLKISVITSSLNSQLYIEDTIKSVLNQNYCNLEYIIIDGQSTDGTIQVIERYLNKISLFISEKDHGQYYAIQKGIEQSTGDIICWLNSDDVFYPWTFKIVDRIFRKYPEIDWLIGQPSYINKDGHCIKISNSLPAYPQEYLQNGWFREGLFGYVQQESMFFRRSLWEKSGGFSFKYKYALDFELWTKFAKYSELIPISIPLASFRITPGEQLSSKYKNIYQSEVNDICKELKVAPFMFRRMNRNNIYSHLIRLLVWKNRKSIMYSYKKNDWEIIKKFTSISKYTLHDLILEYLI